MINNTGPRTEPCGTAILLGNKIVYLFNFSILFSVL